MSQDFNIPRAAPVGYRRQDTLNSPKSLAQLWDGTLPTYSFAVIQAETQSLRWRDDDDADTALTSSNGHILPANAVMTYGGDANRLRFIAATAGAILHVTLYK